MSNQTGSSNTAHGTNALRFNKGGHHNTAIGDGALGENTTGSGNTASGKGALAANTTGHYNSALGNLAGPEAGLTELYNTTAIGAGARVTVPNSVRIGDSAVTSIGGYAAWSNFSDQRSKTDILDIGYGLDFIRQLRPVSFKMKNGNGNTDFGFVAQDIEALLGTEYNVLDIGGGENRMLSLRYSQFIAPMVKALQEQQAVIEAQQAEIADLKEQVQAILTMLSSRP
jgi:hypothetical protein